MPRSERLRVLADKNDIPPAIGVAEAILRLAGEDLEIQDRARAARDQLKSIIDPTDRDQSDRTEPRALSGLSPRRPYGLVGRCFNGVL